MTNSDAFLRACETIVGTAHIITNPQETAGYVQDQRKRFTGKTLAVIQPKNTQEVADVVKQCAQYRIPIVPQGGNTGLVLGSIPDESGTAIVLSLKRMQQISAVDSINQTMIAEAGCLLQQVQTVANEHQMLFPLSLASEGSCTIGGNLASNAGGTAVLRYGNMRELCLGIEFVTAQGDIVSELRGLRKDNTGYDLRHLLIGSEGTLGIITAAVLKLYPAPKALITAMVALSSIDQALQLLSLAQRTCHASLTSFELISQRCMHLVTQHFTELSLPFEHQHAQYVLLEISEYESEEHGMQLLESIVSDALEKEIIEDAVVASSMTQAKNLWQLRERISPAQAKEGKNIKHDISVPVSRIADFIHTTDHLLDQAYPDCRPVTFGHVGDGNLHYNISPPINMSYDSFLQEQAKVNRIVYDSIQQFGGSISAEHGIGVLKRDELTRHKSAATLHTMQVIKKAMDPCNIMNPGKVLLL